VGWSGNPPAEPPVIALRQALESTQKLGELKAALGPLLPRLGATLREDQNINGPYVHLHFKTPIAARTLTNAMGWSRPYATWSGNDGLTYTIKLWVQDYTDFARAARMRTTLPQIGRWALIATLAGRPSGEPANGDGFDLTRSEAQVQSLQVTAWRPEYDTKRYVEQSRLRPNRLRLDVVAKPQTYSGPCPVELQFIGKLRNATYPNRWKMRWERSDGVWSDIQWIQVTGPEQKITSTWKVGAPHQKLVVWQKLRAAPINLESEPARVTIACE
jgi:hypothetical protein